MLIKVIPVVAALFVTQSLANVELTSSIDNNLLINGELAQTQKHIYSSDGSKVSNFTITSFDSQSASGYVELNGEKVSVMSLRNTSYQYNQLAGMELENEVCDINGAAIGMSATYYPTIDANYHLASILIDGELTLKVVSLESPIEGYDCDFIANPDSGYYSGMVKAYTMVVNESLSQAIAGWLSSMKFPYVIK